MEAMMNDRRTEERYPVSVAVYGWSSKIDSFDGQTRDISSNGIYVIGKASIKANERFAFLMTAPDLLGAEKDTAVWAFCRVIRVEPHGEPADGMVGIAAVVEEYVMPTRGAGGAMMPLQSAD
jgi:hypothetical protein